jgi:hypothetical protein
MTFICFLSLAICLGIPDIILINRWNIQAGIPDELIIFGEAAIAPVIRRCVAMPLYIIAAKVCPEGAEATVFAMLTALGNFGTAVSSYIGASLLIIFNVNTQNYDNLKWIICVKMICRSVTLVLVPFLVPVGCPNDPPIGNIGPDSSGDYSGSCLGGTPGDTSRDGGTATSIDSNTEKVPEKLENAKASVSNDHFARAGTVASIFHSGSDDGFEMSQASRSGLQKSSNSFRHHIIHEDSVEVPTKVDTSRYFQFFDVSSARKN